MRTTSACGSSPGRASTQGRASPGTPPGSRPPTSRRRCSPTWTRGWRTRRGASAGASWSTRGRARHDDPALDGEHRHRGVRHQVLRPRLRAPGGRTLAVRRRAALPRGAVGALRQAAAQA
eukprot:7378724-Prymnesium_polylepis.1